MLDMFRWVQPYERRQYIVLVPTTTTEGAGYWADALNYTRYEDSVWVARGRYLVGCVDGRADLAPPVAFFRECHLAQQTKILPCQPMVANGRVDVESVAALFGIHQVLPAGEYAYGTYGGVHRADVMGILCLEAGTPVDQMDIAGTGDHRGWSEVWTLAGELWGLDPEYRSGLGNGFSYGVRREGRIPSDVELAAYRSVTDGPFATPYFLGEVDGAAVWRLAGKRVVQPED